MAEVIDLLRCSCWTQFTSLPSRWSNIKTKLVLSVGPHSICSGALYMYDGCAPVWSDLLDLHGLLDDVPPGLDLDPELVLSPGEP